MSTMRILGKNTGTYCPGDSKSWISPDNLRIEADRLNMQDELKLEEIVRTLENGAEDISASQTWINLPIAAFKPCCQTGSFEYNKPYI